MNSFRAGFAAIHKRPGLVVLTYAVNLCLAFILTLPIYMALSNVVGPTGFGTDLARQFDVVLWADILDKVGIVLSALWAQLFWMIPLYLVWKAGLSVGLIHALRDGGGRSFWTGVGRYAARAVGLGLLYGLLAVVWVGGVVLLSVVLALVWNGEVGAFWIFFVSAPVLVVLGLALIDLLHDYGRIALVLEEKKIARAFLTGLTWPFKHRTAFPLYGLWFLLAAVALAMPKVLDFNLNGIWGLFFLQQIFLLLRAAATVGWFGSEVALFEAVRLRETPLIATEESATEESAAAESASAGEVPGVGPALA
ncbi:hypothetical protein [Rhodocaloribacter sp.]